MTLNFKVIKLENFKFSYDELLAYYEQVVKNYQHLKWTLDSTVDSKNHDVTGIYGWAIQSNLLDPAKPCPPYDIKHDLEIHPNDDFKVPTELIFGFAKKIIDTLPDCRQTVIGGHPPGTDIKLHLDNEIYLKIHIPIKTNDQSFFYFENEKFNLEEGNAYLINTEMLHGTCNYGESDRVHLLFKIPASQGLEFINKAIRL